MAVMRRQTLALILSVGLAHSPLSYGTSVATAPVPDHSCPCCPTSRTCNCGCAQPAAPASPTSIDSNGSARPSSDSARWCTCADQPVAPPRSTPAPRPLSQTLVGSYASPFGIVSSQTARAPDMSDSMILPLLAHLSRLSTTTLLI
jgi:hypothetical protein